MSILLACLILLNKMTIIGFKKTDDNTSEIDTSGDHKKENIENNHKAHKKRKKFKKIKKIEYSQNLPNKSELNEDPPNIPCSYNHRYNINKITSQNIIGENKYYEAKENNIFGDNFSYKKIGILPTAEINHIHSQSPKISSKSITCSAFSRYRNKFITFLYYNPLPYIN